MDLNSLSSAALTATGSGVGFVIKSLAHPERKFVVEAKLSNGKFAIVRLDTGASYMVLGTEYRYDFAMTFARISEIKAEISELTARIAELGATLAPVAFCSVG